MLMADVVGMTLVGMTLTFILFKTARIKIESGRYLTGATDVVRHIFS